MMRGDAEHGRFYHSEMDPGTFSSPSRTEENSKRELEADRTLERVVSLAFEP